MKLPYEGIRYPVRAESLKTYADYRIFPEPWEPLGAILKREYEALANLGDSHVVAIHSPQGTGKSVFVRKLVHDFQRSKSAQPSAPFDPDSIWHRISGGKNDNPTLIEAASIASDIFEVKKDVEWVPKLSAWMEHPASQRLIVVIDNAELSFFRRGLIDVTAAEFLQLQAKPEFNKFVADELTQKLRDELRGALFVLLSNDEPFLRGLHEGINRQHEGMSTLELMPPPDSETKERVVRVNTNRLNDNSYWSCIDQGGPAEKVAVKRAIDGASNFPDTFEAVNVAAKARQGRPAKRNLISFLILTADANVTQFDAEQFGVVKRTEARREWLAVHAYEEGWAPKALGTREASLLESEWTLRVAFLGAPFVACLADVFTALPGPAPVASADAAQNLLKQLGIFHGPGTHDTTRNAYTSELHDIVDAWPQSKTDLTPFWDQGMTRSSTYEGALKHLEPKYDVHDPSFMTFRPDLIVSPFRPCSVVAATADTADAVSAAIRRDAHVFEFTAMGAYSSKPAIDYLSGKLQNYVLLTQEQ